MMKTRRGGMFWKILPGFLLLGCSAVQTLSGCSRPVITPTATATALSSPSSSPTFASPPTPTLIQDTFWRALDPGMERRTIRIVDDQGEPVESLNLLRIDPKHYQFDIAYHPIPQSLEDWQRETGARVVINGSYFRKENDLLLPDGLLIIQGTAFGESYGTFAGMLVIRGREIHIRSLRQTPHAPSEPMDAGLQSFPLLVKPGGQVGFPEQYDDHIQARRTVIGEDRQGRILFLLAPTGYFTLHSLSLYLAGSDLDLDIALNLDGGPSSGWLIERPEELISPLTPLPIVILAFPR